MKLVTVLMLTALPLYCYAGIGCDLLDDMISTTIDPDVDVTEYINNLKDFLPGEETEKAYTFMKECFLHQSEETLEKFVTTLLKHMMVMLVRKIPSILLTQPSVHCQGT
ncbi:mammaglobin-A-like isoform X2 [Phyllostomus discolor]|uniref:Mammaglobin-A-like isoform X2 n=1 Tax=Phyllostomus discolor TaxID=89673 RepID=A0A7E6E276_9CHIR|nr:mammaglobin-A-like isoform X2 [Phyllostomus discolor]